MLVRLAGVSRCLVCRQNLIMKSLLRRCAPSGSASRLGVRCRMAEFRVDLFLSLCCRWADKFNAKGCGESQEHPFQHPFLQVPTSSPCFPAS